MTAPDAADPLYALPPAEFVAARAALAKELRAAGDKDVAAVVAKLRRPSPTAYALNQVARQEPEVLAAALDARLALKEATVAGEDVRDATTADREATRALVAAARAALGTDDAALAQRVTATVLAAIVDEEVAADLRAGRLTAEQASPGFGFAVDDAEIIPFRRPEAPRPTPEDKAAAKEAADSERSRRRAEAEHRKLVARLESRARRLAEKADEAEQLAVEARRESDAAEAELEAARESSPEG